MKNIVHRIKLSVWVLLVLFVTTSCESWLDVKPKTEEEAERMELENMKNMNTNPNNK